MKRTQPPQRTLKAPDQSAVLTKALCRAIEFLQISQKDFGDIIGKQQSSVSQILGGKQSLHPKSKEGELAVLFLRAFRSLDTLMGGQRRNQIAWLTSNNRALNGTPLELMKHIEGLNRVNIYLDAMRGKA